MSGYGGGGKREIIYLSLHCRHRNDCCNKLGSDESHFKDKVTRQCPQTTTFKEKGFAGSSIFCLLVFVLVFTVVLFCFFLSFFFFFLLLLLLLLESRETKFGQREVKLSMLYTLKKDNYFRTHRQPHCTVESQCLQRCRPRPEPPCAGLHWRRVLVIHAWHGTGYVLLARLLETFLILWSKAKHM